MINFTIFNFRAIYASLCFLRQCIVENKMMSKLSLLSFEYVSEFGKFAFLFTCVRTSAVIFLRDSLDCSHCKSELRISNLLVILANEIKPYPLRFKMIELCCQINLRKCGLIMGYSSIIGGCVSMLTSIGNPTNCLSSDCKIFETSTFFE